MGWGWENFTERAKLAISLAQTNCQQRGSSLVEPEDILAGILEVRGDGGFFDSAEAVRDALLNELAKHSNESKGPSENLTLSDRGMRVIRYTFQQAHFAGTAWVTPDILLLGILQEGQGRAWELLFNFGIRENAVRQWHQRQQSLLRPAELGDAGLMRP